MKYISLAAAAVLVGIDQFTKFLAAEYVKPKQSINLIGFGDKEWLNFTYQENTGAAFSILRDKQLFLIILTSIILLGVIIMMLTNRIKSKPYIWSFSLIVAGGAGNLIDRIANNYVIDFIDVRIINFAVFNFADICAVCGTISLIVFYMINEFKEAKIKKLKASASGADDGEEDARTETQRAADTEAEAEKSDETNETGGSSASNEQ